MKVAHIILAHKAPQQLERLINRMQHQSSYFFVHIDKKANLDDFLFLKKYPTVFFVQKRVNINWGGFSHTRAIVNSMKQVISSEMRFDYINLLSGQDYPVKPIARFCDFLQQNPGRCFMEYRLPGDKWLEEAQARMNKYHFTDLPLKGKYKLQAIVNLLLPKRRLPRQFTIIGRSTYFTIDAIAANYIVDCFELPSRITGFFKYSWGSDEIIFQTILFNSIFNHQLINNNMRYEDWSDGAPRPDVLTMQHANILEITDAFFARKFDMEKDEKILERIDRVLLNIRYEKTPAEIMDYQSASLPG